MSAMTVALRVCGLQWPVCYLCAHGTDCNDCGAREQAFECSGPRLGAELAESLWSAGSGYDKHVRPAAASAWRDRGSLQGSQPLAA